MAFGFKRGRISLRERIERNNATDRFYAAAAGVEPRAQTELPPKRDRVKRPADGKPALPLEKHVLAECLAALLADPRVAIAERAQSGLFQDGDRYIRVGTPGKLDISLMLVGGRYGEIECKREGKFPDERQWKRIYLIRNNGGIAGCAHNAAEAIALLP